ncbi:MAG: hypothetical protein F6K42_01500 [Leptolyngbya sp. SIO1D8]|nr:hypothetical protein [Leptolyngbya sp. SIO1D8]
MISTTAVIWGCAVGMFALCIPLTAIANSGPILPILVVLGAVGGTVTVWSSPDKRRREDRLTIQALEDRIMNLETIYTSLPEFEKSPQLLEKDRH